MAAASDGTQGFWPNGFSSGAVSANIKYSNRKDLMLLVTDGPATAAALFTRNLCVAAPVTLSHEHLQQSSSSIRAIVCNSGNANAATGEKGLSDARAMAEAVAHELSIKPEEVLVASTGVIGQLLPMEKVLLGISSFTATMQRDSVLDAVGAIMTTDTFPKFFTLELQLSVGSIRLSGIAKGSGMICPNMATMLAFLATDASIEPLLLHEALEKANRNSFNAITVDGDTSTNDMVSIFASGTGPEIKAGSSDYTLFCDALEALMTFLAKLIVIDGEGATKLVGITVKGAADDGRVAGQLQEDGLEAACFAGGDELAEGLEARRVVGLEVRVAVAEPRADEGLLLRRRLDLGLAVLVLVIGRQGRSGLRQLDRGRRRWRGEAAHVDPDVDDGRPLGQRLHERDVLGECAVARAQIEGGYGGATVGGDLCRPVPVADRALAGGGAAEQHDDGLRRRVRLEVRNRLQHVLPVFTAPARRLTRLDGVRTRGL